MKKSLFRVLAKLNKAILPSFTKQGVDLATTTKWQIALFGYRLWITKRALD
ncbi:MAG: SsrA-binding protein [Flavobacteriaceae bacterium]|nr:SsrA-binding protein [Flavobacteriaceae bacterium]